MNAITDNEADMAAFLADYRAKVGGYVFDPRQGEMFKAPKVVGLWSPAPQSGKSTARLELVGYPRGAAVSFAEPLRHSIWHFLVAIGVSFDDADLYVRDDRFKEVPIPGVGKSFIELAIMFGTQVGRGWIGEDVWVKPWRTRAAAAIESGWSVVSDDMRFPNEAAAVRDLGGVLIGIHRPGAEVSAQRAAAEGRLSLDDMDAVVVNDCDLDTFRRRVVETARRLGVQV